MPKTELLLGNVQDIAMCGDPMVNVEYGIRAQATDVAGFCIEDLLWRLARFQGLFQVAHLEGESEI